MSHDEGLKSGTINPELAMSPPAGSNSQMYYARPAPSTRRVRLFWAFWYACTALLIASIFLLAYSAAWEYSTRRYLKGFSDAIVPVDSTPVEKIQAILRWMSGPAAQDTSASVTHQDRNPEDTLNYASLLKVCGTATNAFINLADSAGLSARRLLLLDSNRNTMHVVAEVSIGGRWIVVDPVFRYIPRGPDGALLTRNELADPKIFSAATRNVPHYDAAYNYRLTAHVHLARVPYVGGALRRTLNTIFPGWSNSPTLSLLLERDSLALLS
ncbi:MAG: transglutaminase domain-containing protein, partial [Candidatus Acidiferrales bacterium]